MKQSGMDLTVITAFSREDPDNGKVYVQHKIRENGQFLAELILQSQASIYVCGRAKHMPKSVEKAFVEILRNAMGGEQMEEDAKTLISKMKRSKRYQTEVW